MRRLRKRRNCQQNHNRKRRRKCVALSEHSAPFDALVQIIEGVAEIKIGGAAQKLSAGESVIMPANVPHALSATQNFKMLLTMIRK